jgi:peptide-methionine (S)-S-oxide reductase
MKLIRYSAAAAVLLATGAQAAPRSETAVLAGGCFWGVEAVFEHVKGVSDVVSGFAGGSSRDANYKDVSAERTRHAEVVRITYDPTKVSYAQLLKIFFTVAHDPTQVNRQGPDIGRSYRSAIFPQTAEQAKLARAAIAQLNKERVYKRPVATRIESGQFFPAPAEHQDFARRNPNHPYIVAHDRPKVAALRARYPSFFRS